jgi:t-SNARE complex subunit (syntaxin)
MLYATSEYTRRYDQQSRYGIDEIVFVVIVVCVVGGVAFIVVYHREMPEF